MDKAVASLLIIDDSESFERDFSHLLKGVEWKVDRVDTLKSGLEALAKASYDIIVTDVDLPDLVGCNYIEEIHKKSPDQVVMVVSSSDKTDDALQALRLGAVDYFQKPINFIYFKEAVDRVVECISQREHEAKMFRAVSFYGIRYTFKTREIAYTPFVAPMLNHLEMAGIIDPNTRLKILLAFQEALTNSIEHGNLELESVWKEDVNENGEDLFSIRKKERLSDPSYSERTVEIECSYSNGELSFEIQDQGKGFNAPTDIAHRQGDKPSLLEYGRGLMIIFGTMDEVEYSDGGRHIRIAKVLK